MTRCTEKKKKERWRKWGLKMCCQFEKGVVGNGWGYKVAF